MPMWKSLLPGDRVQPGDIIRHISSLAKTAFGDNAFEVVKSDLHYFEIAAKPDQQEEPLPERKIIRYADIGYHFLVEIWLEKAGYFGTAI